MDKVERAGGKWWRGGRLRRNICSHAVRQLHRCVNIPTETHPEQNSCRAGVPGSNRMRQTSRCNGGTEVKFSIAIQNNSSLYSPGDNDRLSGITCEKQFHATPDPAEITDGWVGNPQQVQNCE